MLDYQKNNNINKNNLYSYIKYLNFKHFVLNAVIYTFFLFIMFYVMCYMLFLLGCYDKAKAYDQQSKKEVN